jgi:hypothetical protein
MVQHGKPQRALYAFNGFNLSLVQGKYCSKFLEVWMPLAYTMAIYRSSFNWGAIISKEMSIKILQFRTPKDGETSIFYMEYYMLDVVRARNVFGGMNLSWHVVELPVHVYFSILWENRYKCFYALICDEFIARVHFIIFRKECPRLSAATKRMSSKVCHWYFEETSTYIRVFGAIGAPHLLPVHVLDHLILGKICYQTILQGYNSSLVKDKKRDFISYGFHIGFYMVKDTAQAKQEGLSQLEYRFPTGHFHKHDPKGLVLQQTSQVSSCWPYAHDIFKDEIFIEGTQDWEEVLYRRANPNMTKFKEMTMDE